MKPIEFTVKKYARLLHGVPDMKITQQKMSEYARRMQSELEREILQQAPIDTTVSTLQPSISYSDLVQASRKMRAEVERAIQYLVLVHPDDLNDTLDYFHEHGIQTSQRGRFYLMWGAPNTLPVAKMMTWEFIPRGERYRIDYNMVRSHDNDTD